MTDPVASTPTLHLTAGLDRALAWSEGASVRHLVVDLAAETPVGVRRDAPALNLAMAIDVSGSMAGAKLAAARQAASEVTQALGPQDRLTLVAFDSTAELLLDACAMDTDGRGAAMTAIARLDDRGGTNLSGGWLLAGEHLAVAMMLPQRASHRLLLLSDGQANEGITDRLELARHAGELLARGIVTSTAGIGDGYDEALLGAMAEAGGGRLHDAEHAPEIGEVVLGELREGRGAALERARLRITVPANIRAEVIGPWSHSALPGALDILIGTLLPARMRHVVVRLHCPAGTPGDVLGVAARGSLPDVATEDATVEAVPVEVELHLVAGRDNTAQPRDLPRSLFVLQAWQAAVLRRSVQMSRDGDGRAAQAFLERELHWFERYARGVPGAEALLTELVLLHRRAGEAWDERTRKNVFTAATQLGHFADDLRIAPRRSLAEVLQRGSR